MRISWYSGKLPDSAEKFTDYKAITRGHSRITVGFRLVSSKNTCTGEASVDLNEWALAQSTELLYFNVLR